LYRDINRCRACDCSDIIDIFNLGDQCLTGVFPKSKDAVITKGQLSLVWCKECNLLQLKQSYSLVEMYGNNYGYRSSLNQSMIKHLRNKVAYLEQFCPLVQGDLVLDIGSNDATTLKFFKSSNIMRVGVDPVGEKFRNYYTNGIELVPEFFPSKEFKAKFSDKKAKIILSIAMFYDLERPMEFVKEIAETLDIDGIWHFEQSYMPTMLRMNAYDTICHEHLEYYSLLNIVKILKHNGLEVLDLQFNDINGGSIAITAGHKKNNFYSKIKPVIDWVLIQEKEMGLDTPEPYFQFGKRIAEHRVNLIDLLTRINKNGQQIIGYGASTKGNVMLQYCDISEQEIPFIAEVNADKFGSFTPGSLIPIIPEDEARAMAPDFFFVLPWHFKNGILAMENEYTSNGGKFIFPLPWINIV